MVQIHPSLLYFEKTTDSRGNFVYTEEIVKEYLHSKTRGISVKSTNWIKRILGIVWNVTKGEISFDSMNRLGDRFMEIYPSVKARSQCYMYTRNFLKYLYAKTLDPRLLPHLTLFQMPRTRGYKRLTNRIITLEDIFHVINHIGNDLNLTDNLKQNFLSQIMFLAYTGQRPLTMARIESDQLIQAIDKVPPVLTIKAEQDKIGLEHYVPLHPELLPHIQYAIKDGFQYEKLMRYLKKANISLINTVGKFEARDCRKFFEQKSDEIGFTDANKNFIMSHGVSSVNWQSYKQFLPENVYKVYMKYWGNVVLNMSSSVASLRD